MPTRPNNRVMSLAEILRASNQVVGFERVEETEVAHDLEETTIAEPVNPFVPPPPPPPPERDPTTTSRIGNWSNFIWEESNSFNGGGVPNGEVTITASGTGRATFAPPTFAVPVGDRVDDEDDGFDEDTPVPAQQVEAEWEQILRQARGLGVGTPRFPRTARPVRQSVGARTTRNNDSEEEDNEMRTVGQIFGRNPDISTVTPHPLIMGVHRVGVEIEVERFTSRRVRLNYWNMVSDGSLRNNGQEFTFRGPLGGKDAFDAIAEIDTMLYAAKPDLNIRCSTHVHVDVRDMTVPQLKRMILAYAFYESFLFNQSGRYRMKSNFCMPLCIAEGLTNVLTTNWNQEEESFLYQVTERWDKYSAINLIPMRSYGSVEFRIAEGKSSKGQLLRLVNRFLALKEFAMNNDVDDRTFLNMLRDVDYRSVFQKGLSRQVVFSEEDFKTGWVIANDIATLGKMR